MKELNLRVINIPTPTQDDDLKFEFREPPTGKCSYYNGRVCKAHVHRQFWINTTQEFGDDGGNYNEQITIGLWKELISGLEEPCRTSAEVRTKLLVVHIFRNDGFCRGNKLIGNYILFPVSGYFARMRSQSAFSRAVGIRFLCHCAMKTV